MFFAAELPAKKARVTQMNKDKKRLDGISKEAAVKKILEQGNDINALTGVELTTLLKWHGVPKPVDRKVEERRAKWIAISQSGKTALPQGVNHRGGGSINQT